MVRIYFDNAATTPLLPEVIDEMTLIMKMYLVILHPYIIMAGRQGL